MEHLQRDLNPDILDRARGSFLALVAGDSLGAGVEGWDPVHIELSFPEGLDELAPNTDRVIPGQPTDDGEMAIMMAREIVKRRRYSPYWVYRRYAHWLSRGAFGTGRTTRAGLRGDLDYGSKANGALMRLAPVGILGTCLPSALVSKIAHTDAALTHPNRVCGQSSAAYAVGIAAAIRVGLTPPQVYDVIRSHALEIDSDPSVIEAIDNSRERPPGDYKYQSGYVLLALQNALYQLLHTDSIEEALVSTVARGGDTDTNAAICGALVGAVYGASTMPERWTQAILNCEPRRGTPNLRHPRPREFWPTDVPELADEIVRIGNEGAAQWAESDSLYDELSLDYTPPEPEMFRRGKTRTYRVGWHPMMERELSMAFASTDDVHADAPQITDAMLHRAQGCLLGQATGDGLGSLVEFHSSARIAQLYPDGVRDMAHSRVFNTLPGQPTDDTEMALGLARSIIAHGGFRPDWALQAYVEWIDGDPFDYGMTTSRALQDDDPTWRSKANGALMRISPIAVFGTLLPSKVVSIYAAQDAAVTHPNEVCQQANSAYSVGIASAIRHGLTAAETYDVIRDHAHEIDADRSVLAAIDAARDGMPEDFDTFKGYVLIAFQNALYWLLHAPDFETAVVETIGRGSDTDTNAAICGALLGAVHGMDAIPQRWTDAVLNCEPDENDPAVQQPRPRVYWPTDLLELAEQLVALGGEVASNGG